jgi:hypothetical protein
MKVQKCRNINNHLNLKLFIPELLHFKSALKVQSKMQDFIKNCLPALYLLALCYELINFKSAAKSAGIKKSNLALIFKSAAKVQQKCSKSAGIKINKIKLLS